jgi:hypothetical protein
MVNPTLLKFGSISHAEDVTVTNSILMKKETICTSKKFYNLPN